MLEIAAIDALRSIDSILRNRFVISDISKTLECIKVIDEVFQADCSAAEITAQFSIGQRSGIFGQLFVHIVSLLHNPSIHLAHDGHTRTI